MRWSQLSTARRRDVAVEAFEVTHPFHPLYGRRFELLELHRGWEEERVFFVHQGGQTRSMPAVWTSLQARDPFVVSAGGRAFFRPADLLAMVALIEGLKR